METLQETTPPCGGNSLRQRKLAILTVIDGGTVHLGGALVRHYGRLGVVDNTIYNSQTCLCAHI